MIVTILLSQLDCAIVIVVRVITQDAEGVLVTATVFQKVVEEYKLHCRENK